MGINVKVALTLLFSHIYKRWSSLTTKKKFYYLNFHSKIDKHFPTLCHFFANSNYERGDDIQVENLNTYFIGLKNFNFSSNELCEYKIKLKQIFQN